MSRRNRNKKANASKATKKRTAVNRFTRANLATKRKTVLESAAGPMLPPRTNFQQVERSAERNMLDKFMVPIAKFNSTRLGRGTRVAKQFAGGQLQLPPIVGAYLDPWAAVAEGIRYPDSFTGYSGTFTTTTAATITTSPGVGVQTDLNLVARVPLLGTALMCFTPDPSNYLIQGISTGPGFWWPNGIAFVAGGVGGLNAFGPGTGVIGADNVVSNIESLRLLYQNVRLVSGGIRMFGTMNFSTVSGVIHIAPVKIGFQESVDLPVGTLGVPSTNEANNCYQLQLPGSLNDLENLPGYMSYSLSSLEDDEIVAIFQRYGDEAKLFKPTTAAWGLTSGFTAGVADLTKRTGNSNLFDSSGHYAIVVYISGVQTAAGNGAAALTPVMEFEARMNYECQSSAAATTALINAGAATRAPPHQVLLECAADNLCSDVPAIRNVDQGGEEEVGFVAEVARLWKNACRIAGTFAGAVDTAATLLGALAI